MTTAQVVETSVTVNNNSSIQDYVHPDDQTQPFFLSYILANLLFSRVRGGGGGGGYNKVIMFPLNELENGRTFSGKFIAFTKEVAIGRNSKNR